MGATSLLDIITSMVIGSLLLLTALRMDENARTNTYQSQTDLTVQQNITSIIQNLESDFRKIGYCKNPMKTTDPTRYILLGDSNLIRFVADVGDSSALDTVTWYIGGYVAGTPNPNVKMLYRRVSTSSSSKLYSSNMGVTQFTLQYFDASGSEIDPPYTGGNVPSPQLIRLTLRVEPISAYDTSYSQSFAVWRQTRLVSRNLRNR